MENGSLLALGDSITDGHTDSMVRVPGLGFGQWVADSLEYSYTRYARGGFTSGDILAQLLPKVRAQYDLAVLSVGANDVIQRLPMGQFEANAESVIAHLSSHAGRLAVLSVPQSTTATRILGDVAAAHGAVMVDATLQGARLMSSDGIHPTALGQLELADRVAAALGLDPLPSSLAVEGGRGRLGPSYYVRHAADSQYHRARRLAKSVLRR